ncbi:MAG: hypothetical protein WCP11_02710 [Candidatus Saccharibacteria bacterium]
MPVPVTRKHRTQITRNYTLKELSELYDQYLRAKAVNDVDKMEVCTKKIDLAISQSPYIQPDKDKEELLRFTEIAPVDSIGYSRVIQCVTESTLRDIANAITENELDHISIFFASLRCMTIREERPISDEIRRKQAEFDKDKSQFG